jgi:hypothetical protein
MVQSGRAPTRAAGAERKTAKQSQRLATADHQNGWRPWRTKISKQTQFYVTLFGIKELGWLSEGASPGAAP